jgi:hypothetical protein
MKKIMLALTICGLIFTTSCKKEVTTKEETVIHSDGTVTSELDTDIDYVLDLDNSEREYRQAENDVVDAVKRGDAAAEKTAREASAKAKSAWESTKAAMKEAGQDTKEAYNRTLKKAKID